MKRRYKRKNITAIRIRLWNAHNMRRRRRVKDRAKYIRIQRNKRKKVKYRRERGNITYYSNHNRTLVAPSRFSLLEYPEDVIGFINKIENLLSENVRVKSIMFELHDITSIVIGAVCLLLSKLNELSRKRIQNWGTLPKDQKCRKFIEESGFLDRMRDMSSGSPFSRKNKNLILNRGFDKTDNAATAKEIRKAVEHITGKQGYFKPIYSIAQEICANSVEHANEKIYKKNWLFSSSYLNDEVVFTMTDIGDGILKTLKRKLMKQIQDGLFKDSVDVLVNAFEKQYESRTQDPNRNKGLPKIYKVSSEKYIKNLIVVTNNVFLDFDNPEKSKMLRNTFKGTFYYWILNKECIEKWEKRLEK